MSFLCSDLSQISIVLQSLPHVLWLIFKFARNCSNPITLYIYIFFWFNFSMDVYWVHWCLCIYPYSTDFDDWLCAHMEWDLVQYNHRCWKWLLLLWNTCIALTLAEKYMLTLSFFFLLGHRMLKRLITSVGLVVSVMDSWLGVQLFLDRLPQGAFQEKS